MDGIQAWGEPGELRLVWDLDGTGVYTREMPISGSGLAKIPPSFPLFLDRRLFWVREAGGRKLFAAALFWEKGRDGVLRPEKGSLGVEGSGLLRFSCPKPRSLSVFVRTKVVGKPLSGARISLFLPYARLSWVEGGVTDSKGMAHLIVPAFQGDSPVALLVRKKGFSAEVAYEDGKGAYLGKEGREPEPRGFVKEWTFSLEKAEPLAGKVLGWKAEEEGLGLVRLELSFGMGGYPRGGLELVGPEQFARVHPSGEFRFPGIPKNISHWRASLFLTPKAWQRMLGKSNPREAPLPMLVLMTSWKSKLTTRGGFCTFDLKHLRLVPFQILGEDGGPLPFPRVHWRMRGTGPRSLTLFGDHLGRGLLSFSDRVHREGDLYGTHQGRWYWMQKVGPFAKAGKVLPPKEIQVRPIRGVVAGTIVDKDGDPVAGVKIRLGSWGPVGPDPEKLLLLEMNKDLVQGRSDKKGRFRIPFIPMGPVSFSLVLSKNKRLKTVWIRKAGEGLELVFPN
ncbi:MAG TPA: hypothetical protein ENK02_07080 [Planctomycetes bacterium]|nr:hypothetical protein [Planctomycetota bacterium]